MQNCDPLVPLGWAVILLSAFAIVVPILRRTGDALTFWNMYLLGGVIFIGLGCFEVVYGRFDWVELQWFQPTRKDVQIFVVGTILFYITIFTSYYLLAKPIQSVTGRFLNKWPPNSLSLTLLILVFAIGVTIGSMLLSSVFYIGPLLLNVSQKVIVFAVVFSFCHWYQNKRQLPMLILFLGVFAYCALFSMVSFVGRRLLLGVVVAPLFCMYWLKWRYASPRQILTVMAIAGALTFCAAGFYSAFRHSRTIHGADSTRSFANVIKAMTSTGLSDTFVYLTTDSLHFFSQYTTHYSLLTIHLVESGELDVEPLNTLKFLAAYPIPRAIWSGKPNAMGLRLVRDVLRLPENTNWGLGIIGHGYQEGGYFVIILYGFLCVVVIRLMDDAMRRHPDNRFLLATMSAGAPHVLSLTRGDTCTMSAEIYEAFAFVWILGLMCRFIFGTESTNNRGAIVRRPHEPLSG